ncbi:uncharacterized protein LOC125497954 [Beta vulgaris subsp. vulgaris]|uniref:uncharacterized protein LOC125497954 n=1 Tax=Beta vulgaris subsp. vulgaris TaxID=3555 RepID=UPI00203712CA|nr:uncharacterized protein LOC125497954 [Beta vulgaris subsp. vulgaris]
MARSSRGAGKNGGNAGGMRKTGPSLDTPNRKTKSIDVIMGITPLEIDNETEIIQEKILSPRTSLRELQQHSELRVNFSDWIETINKSKETMSGEQRSRIQFGGNDPIPILFDETVNNANADMIKIELEDIQSEIDYWNSALYCYVVGANPPDYVMEGYIRRIWRDQGVDKVAMVKPSIFVVRFRSVEKRDKILNGSIPFFDHKPVILKAWNPEVDIQREEIRTLPIWIQLKLDFKYWGEQCIFKIAKSIGKPIKLDQATIKREKLQYARMLIEVQLNQVFPEKIVFLNEMDNIMEVEVNYEWKPVTCASCKGMGHTQKECRKPEVKKKQIWRAKGQLQGDDRNVKAGMVKERNQVVNQETQEFTTVVKNTKNQKVVSSQISLQNGFEVLADEEDAMEEGRVNDQQERQNKEAEGGSPSNKDG